MRTRLNLILNHIGIRLQTINQGKALSFLQQSVRTRGQQAALSLTLAHTAQADGETYYYVFNNPAGGYVIVGGDDVAHDVLAYSESGSFDPDQLSPATRWWLGQYQLQIRTRSVVCSVMLIAAKAYS